ncbi:MAG: hypothetical protein LBQ55_06715 [Treponema sp.]|jgi:hypothetical protein|nr:hypothetical protein [Treponema sp.]
MKTATGGSGHAVYLGGAGAKKRDGDAGPSVLLYVKYSSATSWTYIDSSAGGLGDTTDNWE